MSTASAPSRLERSAGDRMRSAETSGPTCARSPWRRAVAARSSAPEIVTVVPSSRRSSFAQTTSPGRSAGSTPPQRPAIATLPASIASARAAALGAIRGGALAEAAGRVLHLRQPVDGSHHARMVAQPAGGKSGEARAGAVDVVRALAPEPGAVAFLCTQQPLQTALRDGLVFPP